MDAQTWKDLGLPVNLFTLLNKKIVEGVEAKNIIQQDPRKQETISKQPLKFENSQPNQNSFENAINKAKNDKDMFNSYKEKMNKNMENNSSNQMIIEEDKMKITVEKFLENIVNEIRDLSIYIPILKNLYKIIENIIKNPTDHKFKKIKAFGGFIEKSISSNESTLKFFNWV